MKFPWHKYEELPTTRRNTLQVFITNRCDSFCDGCFARNVMGNNSVDISVGEYERAVFEFISKGGKKINLLGGEPYLHPHLLKLISINKHNELPTTIYTNGHFIDKYSSEELQGSKIRVSVYSLSGNEMGSIKDFNSLMNKAISLQLEFDVNYMMSSFSTVYDMIEIARQAEKYLKCKVFFISSLRELDNHRKEFFDDTDLTMPILRYKEMVHKFLEEYEGDMEIHVSKRGVFESTLVSGFNSCRFSNYFVGGKIIQCPYDIVNLKYQEDYEFGKRFCQHNNTCMMTKVIYKKK